MIDDASRLAVLDDYHILDTAPDPGFDDIVQLARQVCATPVALVSLVAKDRQWFKAKAGLDLCETPLEQSVCAHALHERELLVIEDLTRDVRTRFNPLVTGEPFIRFYAGAVLRGVDGYAIGALCVIDTEPRPGGLEPHQLESLGALARQTMRLLELHRVVGARDSSLIASEAANVRLVNAQQVGGVGSFEARTGQAHVATSQEFCRLLGLPVRSEYSLDELSRTSLDVEDRRAWTWESMTGDVLTPSEFRIRRADDGAVRRLLRRTAIREREGRETIVVDGTIEDITERQLSDARQSALIELGDRLRDATRIAEAIHEAARLLVETLGATRAGYAHCEWTNSAWVIDATWTRTETSDVSGRYPLDLLASVQARLRLGAPISVPDVATQSWSQPEVEFHLSMQARAQMIVPLLQQRELAAIVFVHSDVPRTWTAVEITFVSAVADRLHAAIAKLQAEAQQRTLNDELSHRLKNTLAMVQAIVSRTLRGKATPDLLQAIDDRISAFGKAHQALLNEQWRAGRITTVSNGVLSLLGRDEQIAVEGLDCRLQPQVVMTLSLLLHELGTNAIKYGALASAHGRVHLSWGVEQANGRTLLVLRWEETGGPAPQTPLHRGFGTKLLSGGLLGLGGAELAYLETGLVATFRAPLSSVIETHAG